MAKDHKKVKAGLGKAFPKGTAKKGDGNGTTPAGKNPQVEVADPNEFTDTVQKNVTTKKGNSKTNEKEKHAKVKKGLAKAFPS